MTKTEIIQYANDLIDSLCYEAECERDESIDELAMVNIVYEYTHDKMSKEDMLAFSEFFNYPLDMELVEEIHKKRQKEAEYRARYKAKKRAMREQNKQNKGQAKKGN